MCENFDSTNRHSQNSHSLYRTLPHSLSREWNFHCWRLLQFSFRGSAAVCSLLRAAFVSLFSTVVVAPRSTPKSSIIFEIPNQRAANRVSWRAHMLYCITENTKLLSVFHLNWQQQLLRLRFECVRYRNIFLQGYYTKKNFRSFCFRYWNLLSLFSPVLIDAHRF